MYWRLSKEKFIMVTPELGAVAEYPGEVKLNSPRMYFPVELGLPSISGVVESKLTVREKLSPAVKGARVDEMVPVACN